MKRNVIPIFVIVLAGCSASPPDPTNHDVLQSETSSIPDDVVKMAERIEGCQHFAGEVGDNSPERDIEIEKALAELECLTIVHDESVIRTKYSGNRQAQEALDAAADL